VLSCSWPRSTRPIRFHHCSTSRSSISRPCRDGSYGSGAVGEDGATGVRRCHSRSNSIHTSRHGQHCYCRLTHHSLFVLLPGPAWLTTTPSPQDPQAQGRQLPQQGKQVGYQTAA
jgi:hypothetical protein